MTDPAYGEAQKKAQGVAKGFLERAKALGYPKSGKRVDSAALDYFVGAATAAQLAGDAAFFEVLKNYAFLGVSFRGINAVRELAEKRID